MQLENKFVYGKLVDIYPVITTEASVSVFIPTLFPWEEDKKQAEIILNDDLKIEANTDAELLFSYDAKGSLWQLELEFSHKEERTVCDLRETLKNMDIMWKEGDGRGCDGARWNQNAYTSKTLICCGGILEYSDGPYWGGQYTFTFANKGIMPVAGARRIKIIRISYCEPDKWKSAEMVFRYFMQGSRMLDVEVFTKILYSLDREFDGRVNGIQMYVERPDGKYEWKDLSDLF